jgi:hypothetical protein
MSISIQNLSNSHLQQIYSADYVRYQRIYHLSKRIRIRRIRSCQISSRTFFYICYVFAG